MPSVYDPENFSGRVNFAASYIGAGRSTSRSFDTCFEMCDGDAVATALYRRVQKNPNTKLAENIWRYLCKESVVPTAVANDHRTDLKQWSCELRAESAAAWEKMREAQAARNAEHEAAHA